MDRRNFLDHVMAGMASTTTTSLSPKRAATPAQSPAFLSD